MAFEPTTPVFERSETFHALGREATAVGYRYPKLIKIQVYDFVLDVAE
jgi:hypothetical protein